MSDFPEQTAEEKEAERIKKWRAERAEIVEKEKQERIKEAKEKRAKELADKETADKAKAAALLPTTESLQVVQDRITEKIRKSKRQLIWQVVLFVLVPTAIVVGYLSFFAVPLFEARSVISITKAGGENDPGLGGVLGAIGGPSNLDEAFMANEYIKSQALMEQLEEDLQLITFYGSPAMDPLNRLRPIKPLRISKLDRFSRFVTSSINIQTGLLTLYVRAPDPDLTIKVSNAVLRLTAQHINNLSENLFQRRTSLARKAVFNARQALTKAQTDLTQLQIRSGEANPKVRIEEVFSTIKQLESEVLKLETEIQKATLAGHDDANQTQRLVQLKEGLQGRIEKQRLLLVTKSENGGRSLNELLLDYELALLQVRFAEEALSTTLLALTKASDDAALAQSQFQVVVPPKTAQNASHPNIPKIGFVAFLIFLSALSIIKLLPPSQKI